MAIKKLPTLDSVHGALVRLAASPPLADGTPAFLFRGERADYPQTLSTLDRHCREFGLLSPVYDQLNDVADYALENTIQGWHLHPRRAAAFCQHYGLPTQMFDFTASANVAAFFCANRRCHESKARVGRVAVLDVAKARDEACAVFDLRQFPEAKRPHRQDGFGMMRAYFGQDDILDLKDPAIAASIGLRWVDFAHLPDDEGFLHVIRVDEELLSLEGDGAARLPQDLVDQYVSKKGRLSDEPARILSREIPAIGRTTDRNYRLWSGQEAAGS